MLISDALLLVMQSFTSNRFKTVLSSLGIVIGVMAVLVMLSVGEGLVTGVTGTFGDLDVDMIYILPGGFGEAHGVGSAPKKVAELTDKDVDRLKGVVGVKTVSPRNSGSTTIEFRNNEGHTTIVAISPSDEAGLSDSIEKGRFLIDSDRSSVVLGYDIATNMFKMPINPGNHITLKNSATNTSKDFRVVGVLEEEEQTSLFGGDINSQIFITHQAWKEFLEFEDYSYSSIQVKAESTDEVEATAERIEESLSRLHRNEHYSVFTQKSFLESLNQILTMLKYAMGGIGAISLLVGGIGIINVMMLTVTERIREIGIMKAVGASKGNIRILFLLESGILGLISGMIGVLLGVGIAQLISKMGAIPITITWSAILIGLGFGVLTTTIAGVYPAAKAARLDPVEALRAE